jgi:2-keto-4-pentenoate hydratase/2-oxohepta-3-ene-1,7-dioic acid hydratase in catechol pathway
MDRIYRIVWKGQPRHVVERDGALRLLDGDLFGRYALGDRVAEGGAGVFAPAVQLLAPVAPSKIVAIGLNYKDHAAEQGKPLPREPMLFLKPSTAVIGPGEPIRLPPGVGRVDHEAEMGIVIGRRATSVKAADAGAYVLGVTCSNDVTARDMQNRGYQYSHVKGFDTFAVLGPAIAVGLDSADLAVEGWVNGTKRQASRSSQLVFSAAELIEYISAIMTLLPGDIISTGTPSGIGPLVDGDTVTVRVEGVGDLTNPVSNRA